MTPKTIVENAKKELLEIIITYLRKLDAFIATGNKKLITAPGEDIIIADFEAKGEVPKVRVEVDNTYLDVEDTTYEYLPITKFVLSEGEFYVEIGKIDKDDLSIEELQSIAEFLQDEWEKGE